MTNGGYNITNRMEKLAERRLNELIVKYDAACLELSWQNPDLKPTAVAIDGFGQDFCYRNVAIIGPDECKWQIGLDESLEYLKFRIRFIIDRYTEIEGPDVNNPVGRVYGRIEPMAVRSYGNKIAIGFKSMRMYDKYKLFEIDSDMAKLVAETDDFLAIIGPENKRVGKKYRVMGYDRDPKTGEYKISGISGVWTCDLSKRPAGKPVVSIIMPMYNAKWSLPRALDSLMLQSFADIEIICVDDASTDDETSGIAKWYESEYACVKIVTLENNRGPGHARNVGMEMASGEYIAFMDCDDVARYDMYERLHKCAVVYNADIVICQVLEKKSLNDINIILEHNGRKGIKTYTYEEMNSAKNTDDDICMAGVWNKIMRTDVAKKLKFPDADNGCEDHMCYEDLAYTFAAYTHADKFVMIDEPMYVWDERNKNTTGSFCERYDFKNIKALVHYADAMAFMLEMARSDRKDDVKNMAARGIVDTCANAELKTIFTENARPIISNKCAGIIRKHGLLEHDDIKNDEELYGKLKAVVDEFGGEDT